MECPSLQTADTWSQELSYSRLGDRNPMFKYNKEKVPNSLLRELRDEVICVP